MVIRMGVKKNMEKSDSINSLNWNEIIKLISSGDSARNPIIGRTSMSHCTSPPLTNHQKGANYSSSKLKNSKTNKNRRVIRQTSKEDGYKDKIKKFLTPCKSYPSYKYVDRRLNELERKVNQFEKLYCNALVNWVKESEENIKKSNRDDEIIEYWLRRKERKNIKKSEKQDVEKMLQMDDNSANRKDTINLSKKQHKYKAVVNPERRSAKNMYTVRQIRSLTPSEVETELNTKSNIIINDDETGKYYFVTSTIGYVQQLDKEENQSAQYEAAASVAKFNKKNLLYLFNEEILPKCIGSTQRKSDDFNNNETDKKSIQKSFSDKSTHTERILNDKGINTKETHHYRVEEDSLPSTNLTGVIINTNTDIFETNPSPDDTNGSDNISKISKPTVSRDGICFSSYPLSSSCSSFRETSENYIVLCKQMKQMKN